jgi:ketosteroid isomerase-like protein
VSEANVQLVRDIHERWNRDESLEGVVAEDLEYVNPGYAVEPGTRYGRDSFGLVTETIKDFAVMIDDIVDAGGDDVAVLVHYTALGRSSGIRLAGEQGYVWTVKDGIAVRFKWFSSHREALEAVGIYD